MYIYILCRIQFNFMRVVIVELTETKNEGFIHFHLFIHYYDVYTVLCDLAMFICS